MDTDKLIDEINQDLRADRLQATWDIYGKWVISLAISIVIVTAVVVAWKHISHNRAMKETARYFGAVSLIEQGHAKDAADRLGAIETPEKSTYHGLVLLQRVVALKAAGEEKQAAEALDRLAMRGDAYGDVGRILKRDPEAPRANSPLRYSRMEWAAWALLSSGKKAEAAAQFAAVAAEDKAPATLKERAAMMANYLKNQ